MHFNLDGTDLTVDPVPSFELDRSGRPLRCVVRLVEVPAPAPEGWSSRPERAGLGMVLDAPDDIDADALRSLVRSAPTGTRGTVPYCRILRRPGVTSVQLYLPLERQPTPR